VSTGQAAEAWEPSNKLDAPSDIGVRWTQNWFHIVFCQFAKFHTGCRFARGPIRRRKVRAMPSVKQRPPSKRDEATVTVECSECASNLNLREAVRPDCPFCLRSR